MKININKLIGIIIYLILPNCVFSQKIFSVKYKSQSDINVYVVGYESQSDLNVYKVDYSSQAKGNDGLWYFVKYNSQSDKKIYFVDHKFRFDLFSKEHLYLFLLFLFEKNPNYLK